MEAAFKKQIRQELDKTVGDAKKAFEAASANRQKLEARHKAELEAIQSEYETSKEALTKAASEIEKFKKLYPEAYSASAATPAAPKSVRKNAKGTKAKKAAAAAASPAPSKRQAKKAAGKKAAAKAPKSVSTRASEGRRQVLDKERPTLKGAIEKVLGTKEMTADDIYAELDKRSWLPASNNQRGYVGNVLSSLSKAGSATQIFERGGRGIYRMKDASANGSTKHEKKEKAEKAEAKAEKAEAKAEPKTEAKTETAVETAESILASVKDSFGTSATA